MISLVPFMFVKSLLVYVDQQGFVSEIKECDIHWWGNMRGFKTSLVVLIFEEVML
jgi:hypothetical protein